ncbi:DUF6221 family protein [Amycolatopsis mediterranei]|uniref:DUF6221 family protein n=1 Tax=Amycolatopsis mediterranei TaxID=33910 RepID=UPI0034249E29
MADHEHQVTRSVTYLTDAGDWGADPMVDPLIAFYWARLDEEQPSPDVAAKKAVLDDYAHHCADTENPAREMICAVARAVVQRLATVYSGHPDYRTEWRP